MKTHLHTLLLAIDTPCVYIHIMNSKEIIKLLLKEGWFQVATKGSHIQFKHNNKKGRVTVPHPKKEMPKGTVNSILKQAGLK
jgi:predicted RNA binding protein YcfA (HicA-like mRNA interferase family)